MSKPNLFIRLFIDLSVRLIHLCGGRKWLDRLTLDWLERKDAALLANLRRAKRDRDQFREAAALVKPLLKANPTWKWRDAVAHLRTSGADVPIGNPYLEQLDMNVRLERTLDESAA